MITTKELIQFTKKDLQEIKRACDDISVIDLESDLNTLISRLEVYEYLIFKAMGKKEDEEDE